MVDIVFGIGITALAGALATIAGSAEDTESNIGSQGDPNSQVQLAPQMGFMHRIFNKAVAGEPPAYGLWCALGAGLAWAFMAMHINAVLAIVLGSVLAVFVQGVYATTAYLGRTASLAKFGQPVYVDILKSMTTVTMAHAFIAIFAVVSLSQLINGALGHPFPLPLLALIWGIALGAAGSATGNPYYGKERQYQNQKFGAGVPISASGNIVRYAEAGERNSIDNGWFTAKIGGSASGVCFGLIVFLELWRTILFERISAGWGAIIVGVLMILIFTVVDRYIEVWGRKNYDLLRNKGGILMSAVAAKPAAGGAMNPTAMAVGVILTLIIIALCYFVVPMDSRMMIVVTLIGIIVGGVLIGFGTHFVPVGGAPAAMGQAPGIATGVAMLAAGAGLAGLFGGAWAAEQGTVIAVITGGVGGGLMMAVTCMMVNFVYVFGMGIPAASGKVAKDPITGDTQAEYKSQGTEGHGLPFVSFVGGVTGGILGGAGGTLIYIMLLDLYEATLPEVMQVTPAQVMPIAVSAAGIFAVGLFLVNAVLTAYNITGTIEGPHDPKFKRWPRAIVASALASAMCGLAAILIVVV